MTDNRSDWLPDEMTNGELLKVVRKAIWTIAIGGQEYQIGSRRLRRADLTELRKMCEYLESMVAEEAVQDGVVGGFWAAIMEPR
jgi:hypothetical protein